MKDIKLNPVFSGLYSRSLREGISNAIEDGQVTSNNPSEHQDGDQIGGSSKTGGSDSSVQSGENQAKAKASGQKEVEHEHDMCLAPACAIYHNVAVSGCCVLDKGHLGNHSPFRRFFESEEERASYYRNRVADDTVTETYPPEKPHETATFAQIKRMLPGIHLSPAHAEELIRIITNQTILPNKLTGTEVLYSE